MIKQDEFSVYFNPRNMELLEMLCEFTGFRKTDQLSVILEREAKRLGLIPKKRGRQLRARGLKN